MNDQLNNQNHKEYYCPECKCGRKAIVKKRIVDFVITGTYLACPFCGTDLDDAPNIDDNKIDLNSILSNEDADASKVSDDTINPISDLEVTGIKLSDILNNDASVKDVHFCRDCDYIMMHPYKCYCCLHEKDVSPNDDCKNFKAKTN